MTIITIEMHGPYGISQRCYMADYIDWNVIIKVMKHDVYQNIDETKYFIRTLIIK